MIGQLKKKMAENFTALQQYYNQELIKAVENNDLANVKKYLSQGADINTFWEEEEKYETRCKMPIIMLAAQLGNRDIVEYLLQQPAIEVNAKLKMRLNKLSIDYIRYDDYDDTAIIAACYT